MDLLGNYYMISLRKKYITFVSIHIDNIFSTKLLQDMFVEKINNTINRFSFLSIYYKKYYMICLRKKYIMYKLINRFSFL